jgi:hypothetical protein
MPGLVLTLARPGRLEASAGVISDQWDSPKLAAAALMSEFAATRPE